jgi:hypothetical protein
MTCRVIIHIDSYKFWVGSITNKALIPQDLSLNESSLELHHNYGTAGLRGPHHPQVTLMKGVRSRRIKRGESEEEPDIVEASCLITLFCPLSSFFLGRIPVDIGLMFSSSSMTLGLLMVGCLCTASLAASSPLGATLKMTFMLWLEQLPPTLLCKSLLLEVEMK